MSITHIISGSIVLTLFVFAFKMCDSAKQFVGVVGLAGIAQYAYLWLIIPADDHQNLTLYWLLAVSCLPLAGVLGYLLRQKMNQANEIIDEKNTRIAEMESALADIRQATKQATTVARIPTRQ